MIAILGVYLIIGFLLSVTVERRPSDPLALLVSFCAVVLLWPYILWQSIHHPKED